MPRTRLALASRVMARVRPWFPGSLVATARTAFVAGLAVAALTVAATASAGSTPVRVVSHGSRTSHEIALTFDDGISPANCRRILAILVSNHVPATFFPIAAAMRLDPAFWRLVAEAGYPVGDHTLDHPQMTTLSETAQLREIATGRTTGEAILGRSMLRVFRPPYGSYNAATVTAAGTAGFGTVLLWDTSDRDTSLRGTVAQMLAAAELGTGGSVILMHCGPNATPYVLGPLITYYRAHGDRFVTVPQLLGVPWSPGPIESVSPARILDGLSPLPTASTGGPITGPNGYVPPPGTPAPAPTRTAARSPSPGPSASPIPSGTPTAAVTPGATPEPTGTDQAAAVAGTPLPVPSGSGSTAGNPGASSDGSTGVLALAIIALAMLGALCVGAIAIAGRRRRG